VTIERQEYIDMTTPEFDVPKPIGMEPFAQNGPLGCVPACMANTVRFLLHEDITPHEVDAELQRSVDIDTTTYERNTWLLNRGLALHNFFDPESLIIEKYLTGEATYDDCVQKFAEREYDGDVVRARDDCYDPEYLDFVERLQRYLPGYERLKASVGNRCQEDMRIATDTDVERYLCAGSVMVAMMKGKDLLFHQALAYPGTHNDKETVYMYEPHEDGDKIYDLDLRYDKVMSCGLFVSNEITIVSRPQNGE
jgi:hypothetical protein